MILTIRNLLGNSARRSASRMMRINGFSIASGTQTYEEAIKALNSLQSNTQALNSTIKNRELKHTDENVNLRDTEKFFCRTGLDLEDLNSLSVIHVAGTKGKGSTCNFTDSILQHHNIKTGLFTSPHLITVTERIKLSGQQISKKMFCDYFWEVFNCLQAKKENDLDLPSYFKFLTIMAFYIFVKEKVEVAVIEVGIGGEYDCTNIFRNTELVGITSLHLEHTVLLGNTIEEIAWQKAGIIKPKSKVFVMPQSDNCMEIIKTRARERNTSVTQIPDYESYEWKSSKIPDMSNTSDINKLNISMAIQLAGSWLLNHRNLVREPLDFVESNDGLIYSVDQKFVEAIKNSDCSGRFQRVEKYGVNFFLDGAHTKESIEICSNWFQSQTKDKCAQNFLIYNSIGDRDSEKMLRILHPICFEKVFFTTNAPTMIAMKNKKDDNFHRIARNIQLERCSKHKEIWFTLQKEKDLDARNCFVFETLEEAINSIKELKSDSNCNVLVTGSLHLVGAFLGLLKG